MVSLLAIRLKENVSIEDLRRFGFEFGKILAERVPYNRFLGNENGVGYQDEWAHKFLMSEDDPEQVWWADGDEDSPMPMVQIMFRMSEGYPRDLFIDVGVIDAYHICGKELDIITDTIYELTQAGLIERYELVHK